MNYESLELVELGEAETLVKFNLVEEEEKDTTPAIPGVGLYAEDDE